MPAPAQPGGVRHASGRPLDSSNRSYFESRLGHDFGHVKIHTDRRAAQSAKAMNALAYTSGNNIVFAEAQYQPGTLAGKRLLAHELVHVAQQRGMGDAIQKQEAQTQPPAATPTTPPAARHPECYGRTLSQTEITQRLAIYQDFVRDISGEIPHRESILLAMCSFSINQLTRMQEAGVRFWPPGSIPPLHFPEDVSVEVPRSGLSSYVPGFRMIRLTTRSSSALRHELAHAWDHVRVMRSRFRLDDLRGRRLMRAITASQPTGSQAPTRHRLSIGGRQVRMTIEQMFDAYRARMHGRPRDQAFGTPSAREGYSLTNVRDFYAEGYAVFNSNLTEQQARMRRQAPELYEYFRQQAVQEQLPVPGEGGTE